MEITSVTLLRNKCPLGKWRPRKSSGQVMWSGGQVEWSGGQGGDKVVSTLGARLQDGDKEVVRWRGTAYQEKDKNKDKTEQNRARDQKEHEKTSPTVL
ncbi:hypothetical protein Tco_0103073 [Tanacetum coccineum]